MMGNDLFKWMLLGLLAIFLVSTLHLMEHIYGW